jgi:hypothetical protein
MGENESALGGVFDHGTLTEGDPGTWEALGTPRSYRGRRRRGRPGAVVDGVEGVGGPHRSSDVGERVAPDPAKQRRPVQ